METAFEGLPYRKQIPLKAHPIWVIVSSIGLSVFVLCLTVVLSRVFGMATWGMVDTCLENAALTRTVTPWEEVQVRIFFWFVAYPWQGLLWGMFIGLLLALQANRRAARQRDVLAERLVRDSAPSWRIFFSKEALITVLTAMAFVLLQICGSWVLGVSLITSMYGATIALLLRYRSTRDVYRLAQSKFTQALEQGLIPGATSKYSLMDKLGASFLVMASVLPAVAIFFGLCWGWSGLSDMHESMLSNAGMFLSADDAARLEDRLAQDESDTDARIQLVMYYVVSAAQDDLSTEEHEALRGRHCRHALWLIEHYPQTSAFIHIRERDGDAYEHAKRLWLKNVEGYGDDARVLSNAADFFEFNDKLQALEILQKGKALEPDNPEWNQRITVLELKRQREEREGASVIPAPES